MVYLLRKNVKTKRLSEKLDYTKLRLFKVKRVLGLVTFELDLLAIIKIYLVFHKLLLILYHNLNIILGLVEINKET